MNQVTTGGTTSHTQMEGEGQQLHEPANWPQSCRYHYNSTLTSNKNPKKLSDFVQAVQRSLGLIEDLMESDHSDKSVEFEP